MIDNTFVCDESNRRKFIWELTWFEHHDVSVVSFLIFGKNSFIKWGKFLLIIVSWPKHAENSANRTPSWKWLIEWVKSDNVLIFREVVGNKFPVSDHFVLHTVLVVVDSSEESPCLWGGIVNEERVLLAVFNQRITIGVLSETIRFHRFACSEQLGDWGKDIIGIWSKTE